MSKIVHSSYNILSPWVTLVTNSIDMNTGKLEDFHSLSQSDYVSVFAVTPDGKIPLVKQFRPAVNALTLELPGGLIDRAENPEIVAVKELFEETGYMPIEPPILLGTLLPDTGRLANKLWGYFIKVDSANEWIPEPNLENILFNKDQLKGAIYDGTFNHALHLALIGLAMTRGLFSFDS